MFGSISYVAKKMITNKKNLFLYQPFFYGIASIISSVLLAFIWVTIYPSEILIDQFWGILLIDFPPTILLSFLTAPIIKKRFLSIPQERNKGYLEGLLIKSISCLISFSLFLFLADYEFQPIDNFQILALTYIFFPFFLFGITGGILAGALTNEIQK